MSGKPRNKGSSNSAELNNIGIKTIEGENADVLIGLFEKELKLLDQSDDHITIEISKQGQRVKIISNKGHSYAERKYEQIINWCSGVSNGVIKVNKNSKDEQQKVRQYLQTNKIHFKETCIGKAFLFRIKADTLQMKDKYMCDLHSLLGRPYGTPQGRNAVRAVILEGNAVDEEEKDNRILQQKTSPKKEQTNHDAKQIKETMWDQAGLPVDGTTDVPKKLSNQIEKKLNVQLNNGLRLMVYVHDITSASVEAIVNPANEDLANTGGCAYIISNAAGTKFESDCKKIIMKKKKIKVTENEKSGSGKLPYKCIINAVGPQWSSYDDNNKLKCLEDLYFTIRKVLDTSEKEKIESVAIPPVSSGIFGVPKEMCAPMYVRAIVDFDFMKRKFPREVHVVDISDEILDLTCKAYQSFTEDSICNEPKAILKKYEEKVIKESVSKQTKTFVKNLSPNLCRHIKNEGKRVIFEMGSVKILIYKDDLVKLKGIGTLLSAENCAFTGSGSLAQSILQSAGPSYGKHHNQVRRDLGDKRFVKGTLRTLDAGKLDYRFVIHAIVSRFSEDVERKKDELLDLKITTLSVLRHADYLCTSERKSKNLDKIAMPLLGAGAIKKTRTLEMLCSYVYQGIQEFFRNPSALKEIHLVSFNEETHKAFTKVFLDVSANDFQSSREPPPTKQPLSASFRITEERQETSAPVVTWQMEEPNQDTQDLKKYFTPPVSKVDDDDCIICLRSFINPVSLKSCHHTFCKECISEFFSQKPVCPICNTMYGKIYGDQPKNGIATIFKEKLQLPGEDSENTWVIKYEFPDGKQEACHPNPKQPYKGTRRVAYLPANVKGTIVLHMLERAFKQGLTFTIGFSRTTGRNNVVTWNDIHHKTRPTGGPERFGYPDPDYLERVREELEGKGIAVQSEGGKYQK